jgi:EpsI family protein
MRARAVAVAALVLLASVYVRFVAASAADVTRMPLDRFPLEIAGWKGEPLPPLDDATARVLGADEYLNRRYFQPDGAAVDLFVAYYRSQQHGDAIHSPRNCLPGAGWEPVSQSETTLRLSGREPVSVNRYVIRKGLDRRVVFYWYQGRGRVVSNEYANKGWLVIDAMRTGRTDGGLVRAITPASEAGERSAVALLEAALPPLEKSLP